MPIDLSKLSIPDSADTVLHPRDMFSALPSKHPSYQYPRDVQAEVWNAWFAVRDRKDVVLKMNTGSGKTVVGYTILKSCLNEHKGPAVYVTPDPYLTRQVLTEGEALGIASMTDPSSAAFLAGKAILVVNIYKLINGKSVFGVREETWGMNGADLLVALGGPLRLRVPRQLGYKSVKFIDRLLVTDSLDELTAGSYSWYAGI